MRPLLPIVLLGAFACLPSAVRAQDAPVSPLSATQRRALFDDVWITIKNDYYSLALKGVDWNAVRTQYRGPLDSAATDSAAYVVLSRMLQELHELHTASHPAADPKPTSGVRISFLDGSVVVVGVDSTASAVGLRPGMVVRAVGGSSARLFA